MRRRRKRRKEGRKEERKREHGSEGGHRASKAKSNKELEEIKKKKGGEWLILGFLNNTVPF